MLLGSVKLAGYAPANLGSRKFFLGAIPTGTEDELKLQDDFYEAWTKATTIQARAQVEQDFLKKVAALATTMEKDVRDAIAQNPRPLGFLAGLADDNVRTGRAYLMAHFLSSAGINMPRKPNEPFPASPIAGFDWVAPSNALIERFDAVRKLAKDDLDQVMAEFSKRPWTETPRVAPQQAIPRPGEEQLPSGESGRRERMFLDDIWDAIKSYWWLGALAALGYVSYQLIAASGTTFVACLRSDGLYDLFNAEMLQPVKEGVKESSLPGGATKACPVLRKS